MSSASFIVVPGAQADTEGNSGNQFPFNVGATQLGITSMRYQQVYGASAFPSAGLITQIAFRPDAVNGAAFSSTLPNIRIDLSTTTRPVDGLSTTFADNVGADNMTIVDGALALSSSDTSPVAGPKDFDVIIDLATPFAYNPAAGNLLLDVRLFEVGTTTQLDAMNASGDETSRVLTFLTGDVNSATADAADSIGLVTRFTFTPTVAVPEPSTLALAGTGLGGLGLVGYRRRRQRA